SQIVFEKEELFLNTRLLIQASNLFDIPILCTEEAPQKIGVTDPAIKEFISDFNPISKTSFSCCGEKLFLERLKETGRQQIIVTGIEAHVCVYQTVSDLLDKGFDIQIVSDAITSRRESNKHIALERMKALGAAVCSTEMIICELMQTSQHEKFKEIMSLIK
ncbi:Isochorismatase, partial [hydrothermal vent metagenome]